MNNTQLRFFSAAIMIVALALIVSAGKIPALMLLGLIGVGFLEELLVNFGTLKRYSMKWFICHLLFVSAYSLSLYYGLAGVDTVVYSLIVLRLLMVIYLFSNRKSFLRVSRWFFDKGSVFVVLFVWLEMMGMAHLLSTGDWRMLLAFLLLITISSDSGAWLCGNLFGKRKLWVSVSPNKTMEGAVGGTIICAIVLSCFWYLYSSRFALTHAVIFSALSIIAQLGDLFESKLKRQYHLKDSSNIIPGHGGLYDRLDSVLFVAPFYIVSLLVL